MKIPFKSSSKNGTGCDQQRAEPAAAADSRPPSGRPLAAEPQIVRRRSRDEMIRGASVAGVLGFAFLLPAVFLLCLWLYEFNRQDVQEERVAAFVGHFPEALRNPSALTGISILSSGLAAVFLRVAFSRSNGIWRYLMLLGMVVAVLLLLLNGWQLL